VIHDLPHTLKQTSSQP